MGLPWANKFSKTSGKVFKRSLTNSLGERCAYVFVSEFLDAKETTRRLIQIHFFAHLTVAEVVAAETLSLLLQSFTAVLDEFGVSHGRAKRAALCAAEGLMIVRQTAFLLIHILTVL
jgi:hypothetical protein